MLLVRHPESTKNIQDAFSSLDHQEFLTKLGRTQSADLVDALARRLGWLAPGNVRIVAANSVRAISVAKSLSDRICAPLELSDTLISIKSGEISGRPEREVALAFPEYFRALSLYRSGVVSSYDLTHKGQSLLDYERRVESVLAELQDAREEIGVVVAHRSALTASLIRFARKFHNYPKDFFGYIPIPLASVSVVSHSRKSGSILYVGLAVSQLGYLDQAIENI